jgi:O-antigen/teichoic acid export membrane protein
MTGRLRAAIRSQRSLLATILSLAATTGITSLLGIAFWWLAAHRASMAEVGSGSAAVAAMTLVGTFGMAGLNTVLIGHLSRRPGDVDGVLSAALATSTAISGVLAAGVWMATQAIDPGLAPYLRSGPGAAVFIAGSALTGASLVLDEALLGTLGGFPQLCRNTVFAVAKLGALWLVALAWHTETGTPILTAWAAGTAASLVAVAVALRWRGVRLPARPRWRELRGLGHASVTNTWLNYSLLAPVLATPILVTAILSPAAGGAFYVAATIVTAAVMLPFHFTTALYASSAASPDQLPAKLRFSLRACLLGGIPGVALVIAAAHPLLRVFGAQYAQQATLPLDVMIVSYFGSVLKNHYVAVCRVRKRVTAAAVYGTVTFTARMAAVTAGALAGGLAGVSVALLAVAFAEGAWTIPALRGALRASPAAGRPPAASTALPALP